MKLFLRASVTLVAPILSACAAGDGGSGIVTSDSAGVTIVTVPQQMLTAAPAQQLGLPVLSIGGTSDADIAWLGSAVPLPGDRIAFVNGVGSEVRVHRINGDLEATMGRAGEGPGEFRVPWRLFNWPGDSLLVWDVGLRRASIFAVSGELGRTFQVPNLQEGQPDVHGVLPNGHLLVSSEDRYKHRNQNAVRRDTLDLYRLNSADGSMVPAGRFAGQEQYEMEVPPVVLLEGAPFGAASYVAAREGHTLVADNRAAQISVLDSTGAVVHILRLELAGQPVTAEARKAFERANVDETWRPTYLAAKRQFIAEAPIPSEMPGMGEVVLADDGSYWVAAYVPEHDRETVARTWWVVSREGHVRRRIQTPERFKLLGVSHGHLVGVQRDELDVESIIVFAPDE
jgi:hypothetical protein